MVNFKQPSWINDDIINATNKRDYELKRALKSDSSDD